MISVFQCLKRDEWDVALAEIYRVLLPGSYAQFVEVNLANMAVGPASTKLLDIMKILEDPMSKGTEAI